MSSTVLIHGLQDPRGDALIGVGVVATGMDPVPAPGAPMLNHSKYTQRYHSQPQTHEFLFQWNLKAEVLHRRLRWYHLN